MLRIIRHSVCRIAPDAGMLQLASARMAHMTAYRRVSSAGSRSAFGAHVSIFCFRDLAQRPIIFITGKGDIPTSVRAMKAGAIDFLPKPVRDEDLLSAIHNARGADAKKREVQAERASIQAKIATLTPREREVLVHVIVGRLNKQIAGALGTVEKTIKVHRGRMMEKLGVRSVADLVRLAENAGISPRFNS